jgi:predicted transposase YbfD/YdcC
MSANTLFEHFSSIDDPRQQGKVQHPLFDILFLTISAVIAGCQGWEEIEDFAHDKLSWLRKFIALSNGVPRHDTIARVISRIDMTQFQASFSQWMQSCSELTDGSVVAIDGKRLKGSFKQPDRKDAIHIVSAFACENGVTLGQCKTDSKSNEITAIPELLKLLELKDCLVTIDAMGCQKEIGKQIIEKEADYLLALKANQSSLFEQVKQLLQPEITRQIANDSLLSEVDYQRGREEFRAAVVCHDMTHIPASASWPNLQSAGVIVSYRKLDNQKQGELTYRYYISSANLSAQRLAEATRAHWHIENSLHWCLDVAMNEDGCRIRRDGAAEVFAGVRHIALNLLKKETSFNKGVRAKQLKAARNESYLEKVLNSK